MGAANVVVALPSIKAVRKTAMWHRPTLLLALTALSCGGPIVDPLLDVLVVVPICPHTLADRPIVVSGRSTISVVVQERFDTHAQVTCDGVVLGELTPADRLEIRPTDQSITLLHPPGYDYFRLLRSKLRWGRAAGEHER